MDNRHDHLKEYLSCESKLDSQIEPILQVYCVDETCLLWKDPPPSPPDQPPSPPRPPIMVTPMGQTPLVNPPPSTAISISPETNLQPPPDWHMTEPVFTPPQRPRQTPSPQREATARQEENQLNRSRSRLRSPLTRTDPSNIKPRETNRG